MKYTTQFFALSAVLSLTALNGCATESTETAAAGTTEDAFTVGLSLPVGDPCRDTIAPLALGLSMSLGSTAPIVVSLTSETDSRTYNIDFEGLGYELELDNDSHSMCFFEGVKATGGDDGNRARKSAASKKERAVDSHVTAPAHDDCKDVVKLLAQGLANGAVGKGFINAVKVTLESATDTRDYKVAIDGRDFVANGIHFPNDEEFALELSNDSASKCVVTGITHPR